MSIRMQKVNQEIRKKIFEIIQEEIDDPHLGLVSITRVDTTSDLRECRVYFSVLNDDFEKAGSILNTMKDFIRQHLGKRIRLKFLPKLSFSPDDSIRYSILINQKIDELNKNDEQKSGKE